MHTDSSWENILGGLTHDIATVNHLWGINSADLADMEFFMTSPVNTIIILLNFMLKFDMYR